eukprot:IDg14380t1
MLLQPTYPADYLFPFKAFGSTLHLHLARRAGRAQSRSCSTSDSLAVPCSRTPRNQERHAAVERYFVFDVMRPPRPVPRDALTATSPSPTKFTTSYRTSLTIKPATTPASTPTRMRASAAPTIAIRMSP